jgi:hypothetical protein
MLVPAALALLAAACSRSEPPPAPRPATPGPEIAEAPKVPKLLVEKPEHDAGNVVQGEDLKHTFIVKNVGTGVLQLKRAQGS